MNDIQLLTDDFIELEPLPLFYFYLRHAKDVLQSFKIYIYSYSYTVLYVNWIKLLFLNTSHTHTPTFSFFSVTIQITALEFTVATNQFHCMLREADILF